MKAGRTAQGPAGASGRLQTSAVDNVLLDAGPETSAPSYLLGGDSSWIEGGTDGEQRYPLGGWQG